MMENRALIFIPDISGFTKFMTKCKLEHSRRILFSLIDNILASNKIGLKLSEIEGDAVLFYLQGGLPEKEIIIQQAKRTFIDFHSRLERMGEQLFCGCRCGGCTTASELTLKFIVHYGACKAVPYNGFMKLIGSDVILAHRLLKTAIPDREYILLSEQVLDLHRPPQTIGEEKWIEYRSHTEEIQDFGRVRSAYIPLSPLRS